MSSIFQGNTVTETFLYLPYERKSDSLCCYI